MNKVNMALNDAKIKWLLSVTVLLKDKFKVIRIMERDPLMLNVLLKQDMSLTK